MANSLSRGHRRLKQTLMVLPAEMGEGGLGRTCITAGHRWSLAMERTVNAGTDWVLSSC